MSLAHIFSYDLDQQLIELVRAQPSLYDSRDPRYRDTRSKDSIWEHIGATLDRPALVCKERWRTMRDAYKKIKKKCDKGLSVKSKYGYNHSMSFIDNFFYGRAKKRIKMEIDLGDDKEEDEDDEEEAEERDTNAEFHWGELPITTEDTSASEVAATSSTPLYSHEQDGVYHRKARTEHPVDAFFSSMAAVVKTLPPHLIAQTRVKVCTIVSEMEMQGLTEQNK